MQDIDLIRVVCPNCAKRLRVKAERAGQQIRCPNKECARPLLVPFASDSEEESPSLSSPLRIWLWLLGGSLVGMLLIGLIVAMANGNKDEAELPVKPVAQVKKPRAPEKDLEKPSSIPVSRPDSNKPPANVKPKEKSPVSSSPSLPDTPPPAKRRFPKREDERPPTIKLPPSRPEKPIPEKEAKKAEPVKKRRPPSENQFLMLPLKAIGKTARLEKLKAVRVVGKASFASTVNRNNIILMWCWDPRMVIRLEEDASEGQLADLLDALAKARQRTGRSEESIFMEVMKKEMKKRYLDAKTARRYEDELRTLTRESNYKPLFYTIWMIENKTAYQLFNDRVRLRARKAQVIEMRNLCFALSVSNLLPLKRHKFEIKRAEDAQVKGKDCSHFKVQDPSGMNLDFYFDKQTELLAKIAHWGPSRKVNAGPEKVRWEHYFADYRVIDGLKQWHRLQIQHNGLDFATIDVNSVQYFDSVLPELQREDPDALELAKKAADLLMKARETIRNGNINLGMVRLRIIVMDYAETPAAAEAAKLLKELKERKE